MIACHFDRTRGIIVTVSKGFNTEDEVRQFVLDLAAAAKQARAATGSVLHLVDGREAMVQSSAGNDALVEAFARHGETLDRTAIVLSSALVRMQVGRLPESGSKASFSDMDEAVAWLKDSAER